MSIPDFQTIMLPLLKFAADQQEHPLREAIEELALALIYQNKNEKSFCPAGNKRHLTIE